MPEATLPALRVLRVLRPVNDAAEEHIQEAEVRLVPLVVHPLIETRNYFQETRIPRSVDTTSTAIKATQIENYRTVAVPDGSAFLSNPTAQSTQDQLFFRLLFISG